MPKRDCTRGAGPGPVAPSYPSVAEGNGKWRSCPRKSAQKRTGVGPATSSPLTRSRLLYATSLRLPSSFFPFALQPPLSLSSLLSASLLILRPLPLNKKRLFLARALSSDPFLEAPGCLLRTRAPAERSGGAEPAPAPADLRSRRGRFASVR